MSNAPSSNICTFDETSIRVREEDLCENLIGKVGLTEFIFFLILGNWPTPAQTAVVDACLIPYAEQGICPGPVPTRMADIAALYSLHGADAALLLGVGHAFVGTC